MLENKNEIALPSLGKGLIDRFKRGDAKIGVVGLGYVGLPLAMVLAEAGFEIIGVDQDPAKIKAIRQGESYIEDVSSEALAEHVAGGRITVSDDFEDLR